MIRAAIAAAAALILQGCGGVEAQTAPGFGPGPATPTTTTPAPAPPTGGADDGYSKALRTIRDTFFATGGAPGFVNAASFTKTIAGEKQTSFEWATLSVLDNYSNAGENVAAYFQGNKMGNGPTWGAVSEVNDTTGKPGAMVAHEFDVFVTGPDNGLRIGLDVLNGDGQANRGYTRSLQADATTAIRIGQSSNYPWATWGTGIELTGNYRESVIRVKAPDGRIIFEIKPNGDGYKNGVRVF